MAARPITQVLNTHTANCLVCNEQTPQELLLLVMRPRVGLRRRNIIRAVERCEKCGNQRIALKRASGMAG